MLTDFYQITMAYAYWKAGVHEEESVFDLFFRKNPFGGEFAIYAGLEEKLGPLFAHLRASPLGRLRIWEDEIVRHSAEGRRVLQRLAQHADPKVAAGAKALLEVPWRGAPGEVKP
jgi:nicotinic acid phosphoribosyltransferase